jgi:RNA polymerase sigma-70 factor (ECF subfamily)
MSLKQLVQNCKKRDIKSQSEIYQLFAGKLYALCLKYSKTKHEADDNLQDAFITIFKKIDQFKHKGSFEGWMKRIVINTALQSYREKNVLNLVEENYPDEVEVEVDDKGISLDFLLKIIQELPERYRMVFNLYVLDGYSHKEISSLMNIAEGTSKSNLSRARLILKEKVELNQQQQSLKLF